MSTEVGDEGVKGVKGVELAAEGVDPKDVELVEGKKAAAAETGKGKSSGTAEEGVELAGVKGKSSGTAAEGDVKKPWTAANNWHRVQAATLATEEYYPNFAYNITEQTNDGGTPK